MRRAALVLLAVLTACQARAGGERGTRERSGEAAEFSGQTAFGYVERQMAFGPRVPGTPGHQQMGDWLLTELRARADTVVVQPIRHVTRDGKTLQLRNFFARFNPAATERVLYVAHWDTRPVADKSQNLGQQRMPVPGANDGASGVAVLLGVADALKARPARLGVDLLFVDGEDYGDWSDPEHRDVLIGSRWFARNQPPGYQPLYAVVWDMVGDKDLQFPQEGYSVAHAPEVVRLVWEVASRLGYQHIFVDQPGQSLTDDHIPLQEAGIRAIDVIDFDYPYWHTTEDTLDKVSAASLQIVGDVAVALVRN